MRWKRQFKAMARSTRKTFLMIEKLFYAFRSVLTFPLDGGRQGWGCKKNKNAEHAHPGSGPGQALCPPPSRGRK